MRDGIEQGGWESHRPKLTYPFDKAPETGEAVDIAPGVKWLRMPLGGSLAWINVWAIADGDGWAIVDTGISGVETRNAWRAALSGPLEGKPVTRVFVTHMHPDHIGMSGYLTRKFNARLWITRLEFVTCRSLAADTGREAPADATAFFKATGWDEEALESPAFTAAKSLRSLPAVKMSPLAWISTQRIDGSSEARSMPSPRPWYMARVRAFFFSGRLIVSVNTPLLNSDRM